MSSARRLGSDTHLQKPLVELFQGIGEDHIEVILRFVGKLLTGWYGADGKGSNRVNNTLKRGDGGSNGLPQKKRGGRKKRMEGSFVGNNSLQKSFGDWNELWKD